LASSPAPFEVLTASNPSPYTLAGTNTYVLRGPGETTAIIDPGPDDAGHVRRVVERVAASSGRRLGLVLLTHGHSDHRGAADALARATGVVARGWSTAGRELRDGEVLALDGEPLVVMHTPGHASDHVVFYWEAHRVLFSGDLILGQGTVNVTPPDGSMAAYLGSLERVARLSLTLIAPGHGPLIRDPAQRIAEYRAHRQMREQQVLALLAPGPRTVPELVTAIYPELDPRLTGAASGTVTAHLEKLIDEGHVVRNGARFTRRRQEGEHHGSADRD
jgi:glyoxylase-like metal-dependent hydrolase (beta-lactamase superfamily II)